MAAGQSPEGWARVNGLRGVHSFGGTDGCCQGACWLLSGSNPWKGCVMGEVRYECWRGGELRDQTDTLDEASAWFEAFGTDVEDTFVLDVETGLIVIQ